MSGPPPFAEYHKAAPGGEEAPLEEARSVVSFPLLRIGRLGIYVSQAPANSPDRFEDISGLFKNTHLVLYRQLFLSGLERVSGS